LYLQADGWLFNFQNKGTMEKICINGKEYSVVFNMTTVLCYEEIVDKSFFGEDFSRNKERMALILAACYAADENTTLSIDELRTVADWSEMVAAFNKVMSLASNFFNIPKVVSDAEEKEAKETTEQEKGESPKN
jgi:hypothetical protein